MEQKSKTVAVLQKYKSLRKCTS